MGIIEYNYEWTRAFHTLFLQIVAELGDMCNPKLFSIMTAGLDWQYKCMNYGKLNLNCCAIDYCLYTLDITIPLLTNPAYFSDRENIRDRSGQVLPKTMIHLYRMLAYIYYHHRKLFDSLQYRYRIAERLTLYCKKFKGINDPK
jgi:hypothetical protein